MQSQEEVGIRDIATINDILHVPRRAVERLAQLSEVRDEMPEFAFRIGRLGVWDTADEEQPRALQLSDGAQEPARRFEVTIMYIEVLVRDSHQC